MRTALIISLNFNPGHVSHLRASYRQFEELGYESWYYVNKDFRNFLPKGSRALYYGEDKPSSADVAIIWFPSQKNLNVMWSLHRCFKTQILYCFHEPVTSFQEYHDSGYTRKQVLIERIKDWIGAYTSNMAEVVILPSKKAYNNYLEGKLYKNPKAIYLPLMYDDERMEHYRQVERKFFSYIGTVASDHSFNEYVSFIKWAYLQRKLANLSFMIATRSTVICDELMAEMVQKGRLKLIQGKPMEDETINECYASSFVVWNAYTRSMQSGVLAKSFMFGTPAIILKKNLSEFTEDGKDVQAIEDNTSFEQIERAILIIMNNFPHYSNAARGQFEEKFYFKCYNKQIHQLLNIQTEGPPLF